MPSNPNITFGKKMGRLAMQLKLAADPIINPAFDRFNTPYKPPSVPQPTIHQPPDRPSWGISNFQTTKSTPPPQPVINQGPGRSSTPYKPPSVPQPTINQVPSISSTIFRLPTVPQPTVRQDPQQITPTPSPPVNQAPLSNSQPQQRQPGVDNSPFGRFNRFKDDIGNLFQTQYGNALNNLSPDQFRSLQQGPPTEKELESNPLLKSKPRFSSSERIRQPMTAIQIANSPVSSMGRYFTGASGEDYDKQHPWLSTLTNIGDFGATTGISAIPVVGAPIAASLNIAEAAENGENPINFIMEDRIKRKAGIIGKNLFSNAFGR